MGVVVVGRGGEVGRGVGDTVLELKVGRWVMGLFSGYSGVRRR